MMGRRGLIPGVGLIAWLALGCEARPAPQAVEPTSPAAAAPSVAAEVKPVPPGEVPAWKLGDERRYTVRLESEARVDDSPLTEFVLNAELTLVAVEADRERVVLHAAFAKQKLETTLRGKASEFLPLERELSSPFLFELGKGGAWTATSFSDTPSSLVVGLRYSVAAALQAHSGTAESFTAVERDATGRYEARYERTDAPSTFKKTKLRYLALHAKAPAALTQSRADAFLPQIEQSSSTLKLAAPGVVESLESNESVRTGNGQMLPVESKTALALRPISATSVAPPKLAAYRAPFERAARYTPERPWVPRVDPAQNDEAKIGARSLEGLLAELRSIGPVGPDATTDQKRANEQARGELYTALEAMVRSRAGTVPRLVALVRADDPLKTIALDALGSSGSADAQSALLKLIRERKLEPSAEKLATISLTRAVRPTADTLAGMVELLDVPRLKTQATYGLGTAVRRLREAGEEQRARAVLDIVLARLQKATSAIGQITALRAIANSGHEAAYPLVEPLLAASDDEVRAAAVESLQIMQLPAADRQLGRSLTSDSNQSVRLAAARAIRLRAMTPELESAALTTGRSDADPHVRLAAIRILASWAPDHPKLRTQLRELAAGEKEEAIRRELEVALAPSTTG
ncbi:MAG TPA: HEAT repeat domain-containing protein [Polyangiaceae bacterium]|nr:HEAT repeat domain-containing protein [Polyangiaceae bacterium]